jgi:uncharacterized protein (UPF0216 family)
MNAGISEEGVLRKLLEQMNAHVPSRRQRLSVLLRMEEPHYVDRNGREMVIERTELELIRDALRERALADVKLPIILIADAGHAQSTWRVQGEDECAVVASILGRDARGTTDRLFLYAPHVAALRRKLPTATACIFVP